MMIFHWCISDSKSPHILRTLLTMLLDSQNSSSDLYFPLSLFYTFRKHSKGTNYNWYYRYFSVPQLFRLSVKIQVPVYLFGFLSFSLQSARTTKSIQWLVLFFFLLIDTRSIFFSWIYLKVPENFMGPIFLNRFWGELITFISLVIFQSFAQFLLDHLSYPVMSFLVFLLVHSLIL